MFIGVSAGEAWTDRWTVGGTEHAWTTGKAVWTSANFLKRGAKKKEAPKEAKSLSHIQQKLGTVRRRTGGRAIE
jgi:hypothetical protein